jgi:hypothetical protein
MLKFLKVIGSYILTILIFLQAIIGVIANFIFVLSLWIIMIAGLCYAGIWLWNIIF